MNPRVTITNVDGPSDRAKRKISLKRGSRGLLNELLEDVIINNRPEEHLRLHYSHIIDYSKLQTFKESLVNSDISNKDLVDYCDILFMGVGIDFVYKEN